MQQPVKLTVRESAGGCVLDMLVEKEREIDQQRQPDLGVAAAQQGGIDPGGALGGRRCLAVTVRAPAPFAPIEPRRTERLIEPVSEIAPVMVLDRTVADLAHPRLESRLERGAALGRVGG